MPTSRLNAFRKLLVVYLASLLSILLTSALARPGLFVCNLLVPVRAQITNGQSNLVVEGQKVERCGRRRISRDKLKQPGRDPAWVLVR